MLLLRGICIESIRFLLEKILDSGLRIITIRVDNEDTRCIWSVDCAGITVVDGITGDKAKPSLRRYRFL
jgi:hypothetical protein